MPATAVKRRPPRHVFYLHGFASSPRSKKASYFAERLAACGLTLQCPDFNEPDFASLTMTRMLDQVQAGLAGLDPGPVALIGSSLGAVVALHAAGRLPDRVDRLVLLAPALMFARQEHPFLGLDRMRHWRETGSLDIAHHAFGEPRPLAYGFYEDCLRYDVLEIGVRQPMLIFQGRRDEAVDYRDVERYAAVRPNVTLTLLDDDHQLIASLPRIWDDTAQFLGLSG